jgi:hypothetical protein
VVYGLSWSDSVDDASNDLVGKNISIMSAGVTGSDKHALRNIAIPNGVAYTYISAVAYSPQVLYVQTSIGSQSSVYYIYQYQNDSATQSSTITNVSFNQVNQGQKKYLASPSNGATFWSEQRDGKNTLFVGDANGANGTQIATQSDYAPYGWFTDNYLLVQKGGNELYIEPVIGGTPSKISDYYANSTGYVGGSYGDM